MRLFVVLPEPDDNDYEPDVVYLADKDAWLVEMLYRSSAVSVAAPTLEEAIRKFASGLIDLKKRLDGE